MKIKSQLYLSSIISIGLVAMLISVIFITSRETARQNQERAVSRGILQAVSELDILVYEYLLHHEKRAEKQWYLRYNSLGTLLSTATGVEESERISMDRLSANFAIIGNSFTNVNAGYEKTQSLIRGGGSQTEIAMANALEDRNVARLLIASQSIISDASMLAEKNVADLIKALVWARNLTLFVALLLLTSSVITALTIARTIAESLHRLHRGTEIIGSGNLEHTIDINKDDEIGQLSRAFNQMAADLKTVTVSKLDLEKEIIERRRAEAALAASEEHFRVLAEALPQIVWTANADGTVEWLNQRWYDYTSGAQGIVAGRSWEQFVHPDDMSYTLTEWAKVRNDGTLFQHEIRVRRYDGQYHWFLVRAWSLRDKDGKVVRWFGTNTDIQDLKQAEEILTRDKETFEHLVKERTDELMSARLELERVKRLSDIGTLAATVAHELRNPLAAIGMAAYNIKRKTKSADFDKHLSNIEKKVVESDQIINNLLFYSRIRPPYYETINIQNIIEEIIDGLGENRRKNAVIISNIDLVKEVYVEADPVQIREVVHNLLNNACDALPAEGGKIEVISIAENGTVKITISDNGHGMDQEILTKIFDPFFTTKARGTGLGLPVCQQIINLHNGTIRINSEVKKGTTVTFSLPGEKG